MTNRSMPSRLLSLAFTALAATGCTSILPYDGPLERQVLSGAQFAAATPYKLTYGLVDLDSVSVRALDDFDDDRFLETFGLGSSEAGIRIGRGDVLEVTIFEAGPDGLFSTTEQKQVSLPLTVQGDGRISVPYAGAVQAAGRTAEQIRGSILAILRERAVEPDVIVNLQTTVSRSATVVSGEGTSGVVPLTAGDERVLDAIAQAGGLATEPFETLVTLQRGGRTCTMLVQTLIDRPHENIFIKPGDTIILSNDPRSYSAFGAVSKRGVYDLKSAEVSLAEAAAQAQGLDDSRANPQGYFVFRYERESVVRELVRAVQDAQTPVDLQPLHDLLSDHTARDSKGRIPMVYRVNLAQPEAFFVSQRFAIRDKDVIYVARSFSGDISEFLKLVNSTAGVALAAKVLTD